MLKKCLVYLSIILLFAPSLRGQSFPTQDPNLAAPRYWNEILLESIRRDFARPTVHARNLFHTSIAMYDAWAVYNQKGCNYLLGETVDGFSCYFQGFTPPANIDAALDTTISYAMYRILSHRFNSSPQASTLQAAYNNHLSARGYDNAFTSVNYVTGGAAALGNYIGQCIINFGLQDLSYEQYNYANLSYSPVNPSLIMDNPGNPRIVDLNRWQPLTLEVFIDQSGNTIPGNTPSFLSPEWGQVSAFALSPDDLTTYQRNNFDYQVYHDPGNPPYLQGDGLGYSDYYKWGFAMVSTWSSHLDPSDGVMMDISPASVGNTGTFPSDFTSYANFYDQLNGGIVESGHAMNPVTGQAYAPNIVPRGDYTRVLAEFWADGPDSETPPGHWFTLINETVADHPLFEMRFQGQGPILDESEWYIKSYFMLGGAMHDAAVTAWGAKGWYDYLRPVSALRAMSDRGQSSDPNLPSYHLEGLPLIAGYIELVEAGDPLAGAGNADVGKLKVKAWRGHPYINNTATDVAGVGWILAENWEPYQRESFVTPPFAGYVSGHSTFSRAAAEVLTLLTGDAYFPGGMATFTAPQNDFLVFEQGPSVDIELQWATYRDASDQCSLSRIWGGIHPPADDIPGRLMGEIIGIDAFYKALSYFEDYNENGSADLCELPACECSLDLKAFLAGPLDNGMMTEDLFSMLPDDQPFSAAPWFYNGTESIAASTLQAGTNDTPTDWVLVQLLDKNNPSRVLATKAGLIQRDGDVVDVDGITLLSFSEVVAGDYFVVLRARNHIAVRSASPVTLGLGTAVLDFTTTAAFGTASQETIGAVYALWSGDATKDGIINAADRSTTWNTRNQMGYMSADLNMDGLVNAADRSIAWNSRNRWEQME